MRRTIRHAMDLCIGKSSMLANHPQTVIRVYDDAGNVSETHEHHDGAANPEMTAPKRCQAVATILAGLIRRLGYRRT